MSTTKRFSIHDKTLYYPRQNPLPYICRRPPIPEEPFLSEYHCLVFGSSRLPWEATSFAQHRYDYTQKPIESQQKTDKEIRRKKHCSGGNDKHRRGTLQAYSKLRPLGIHGNSKTLSHGNRALFPHKKELN